MRYLIPSLFQFQLPVSRIVEGGRGRDAYLCLEQSPELLQAKEKYKKEEAELKLYNDGVKFRDEIQKLLNIERAR